METCKHPDCAIFVDPDSYGDACPRHGMSDNTAHTPTPWQQGNFNPKRVYSCEENGPRFVASFNNQKDLDVAIRAVNHHAELVDCLRRHYSHAKKCGHLYDCVCLEDEARALLAKVGGA